LEQILSPERQLKHGDRKMITSGNFKRLMVIACVAAIGITAGTPPSLAARMLPVGPQRLGPAVVHHQFVPPGTFTIGPSTTITSPPATGGSRCRGRQTCPYLTPPITPIRTTVCYGPKPAPNACGPGKAPWCEAVVRSDGTYTGYGYWHCVNDHRSP
jgi:hypothetical protein